MKKLRPALIGFVLGGGITTKISQLFGQALEIESINLLSGGMIIGGLIGTAIAVLLTSNWKKGNKEPKEINVKDLYQKSA